MIVSDILRSGSVKKDGDASGERDLVPRQPRTSTASTTYDVIEKNLQTTYNNIDISRQLIKRVKGTKGTGQLVIYLCAETI